LTFSGINGSRRRAAIEWAKGQRGIFVYFCLSRDMSSAVPFMPSQKVDMVAILSSKVFVSMKGIDE
jgi:hypothetical protein